MKSDTDNSEIKVDDRPAFRGYAPGGYFVKCRMCEFRFMGDKRASHCADCAYGMGPIMKPLDDIAKLIDESGKYTPEPTLIAALRQQLAEAQAEAKLFIDKSHGISQEATEWCAKLKDAQAETQRLRQWKSEMLQVESEWDEQALAKLLGVPLGQSCRKGIQEKATELVAQLAESQAQCAAMREKGGEVSQEIIERDDAEEAMSQAYYLVTGRSPEWSNVFGYPEALNEIRDAITVLKATLATPAPAVVSAEKVQGRYTDPAPSEPTAEAIGTEDRVCADIAGRQQVGLRKYGVHVADNPLTLREWLQHAYEECLDQSVYLRRAMDEMDSTVLTAAMKGDIG